MSSVFKIPYILWSPSNLTLSLSFSQLFLRFNSDFFVLGSSDFTRQNTETLMVLYQ